MSPKPTAPASSAGPTTTRLVEAATPRKPPPMRAMPASSSGRWSDALRTRPAPTIEAAVAIPKPASQSEATAGRRPSSSSAKSRKNAGSAA